MMKDTVELTKFKRLVRTLSKYGETRRSIIGLLEMLWRTTSIETPDGAIGLKLSDDDIAAALEFDGEPADLVNALVDCGWLDRSDQYRIVVHDWASHCPLWVRAKMKKTQSDFVESEAETTAKRDEPKKAIKREVLITGERTGEGTGERTGECSQECSQECTPRKLGERSPSCAGRERKGKERKGLGKDRNEYFESWWEAYPRKVGKQLAEKCYTEAVTRLKSSGRDEPRQFLLERAIAFASSDVAQGDFVPHPSTWLRQGRYDDDPSAWSNSKKQAGGVF